jgi:hypothetical protein
LTRPEAWDQLRLIRADCQRLFWRSATSSLRSLLPQLCDVPCGDLRALAAKASGDVVGDGCNLGIGIDVAKGRHRDHPRRSMTLGAGDNDLRDTGRSGIVDGPGARERGEWRDGAFAGPAVTAYAGTFEYHLAARVTSVNISLSATEHENENRNPRPTLRAQAFQVLPPCVSGKRSATNRLELPQDRNICLLAARISKRREPSWF